MASIGNLAAILSINPSAFVAGLEQAAVKAKSFAAETTGLFAGLGGFAPLAGLASVGGAAAAINSGLSDIAARAKDADRLGISMQDVAGFERLAGTRAEEFQHALGKLSAEIGAAQAGSKEAGKKFQELGISLDSIASGNLADKYRVIADQIAKLPTATERAYAAHQLLGKSGAELAGIIAKGAAGFDEAREKAAELGLVLDRDVAQRAIEAKRTMAEFNKTLKALGEQAAITAAGPVTSILKNAEFVIGSVSKGIIPGTAAFAAARDAFLQSQRNAPKTGTDAEDLLGADKLKQAADFAAALQELNEKMDIEEISLGQSAHMHEVVKIAMTAVNEEQEKAVRLYMARAQAMDETIERMKAEAAMQTEGQKVIEENMSTLEKFQHEMEELNRIEAAGMINRQDLLKGAMRGADKLRSALGVDQGPGVVSAAEAGSAQAQQTLAQVESRGAFDSFDDMKNLLALGNELAARTAAAVEKFAEKNQEILAASF
jgi:hypothetical protein